MVRRIIISSIFALCYLVGFSQGNFFFNQHYGGGETIPDVPLTESKIFAACVRDGSETGYIYISNDYGSTWSATSDQKDWNEVSISATGKYVLAAPNDDNYFVLSEDSGATWSAMMSYPANDWECCAISSTGQFMYIAATSSYGSDGLLYKSSDYGSTFNGVSYPTSYFYKLECSGNGQYLLGSPNVGLYMSDDYGATWTQLSIDNLWGINSISISEDGQFMIVAGDNTTTDYLWISFDYGENWDAILSGSSGTINSASMSANGMYVSYVGSYGDIYYSSDYGTSWTRGFDAQFYSTGSGSISVSYGGQYQISVINPGYLHVSTNYGVSWTAKTSLGEKYWYDVDSR